MNEEVPSLPSSSKKAPPEKLKFTLIIGMELSSTNQNFIPLSVLISLGSREYKFDSKKNRLEIRKKKKIFES